MDKTNALPGSTAHTFANLHFRYPFRRYQRMVLDVLDGQAGFDHKYHIVAPPGSGKTIVGLELIRRFGQPAVVFCPTTTIQKQWQEKVGMFTSDAAWLDQHTSLDPRRLAEINVLTYQVLSTPGENLEFVERIAVERWVDDLLESNKAHTATEARQRIVTLKEANPKAHRREISKRYRRLKREFLHDGTLEGRQFLHPNARALIDRIVAQGTGTVVLDECHHLLDYWAFILRELLKALPGVRVVGLTATLPDPENQAEYENYTSLLGEVDFEVPTPAVVKEGNLAPYRDLVHFCEPSPREQDYLHQIQRHFEETVWQATNSTPFQDWLWQTLFPATAQSPAGPYPEEAGALSNEALLDSFQEALRREPLQCTAGIRYLLELGVHLPLGVPLVEEMMEPLGIDDWLILMENYALRALKVSAEPQHQALYRDLCDALLPFGITISERGIRHHRSPGDLVLALSESKDRATVDILRAESQAMEEKLRAVVITDYERMSARTRRLKGILDPDAGSAVRVFRRLVADPVTELLAPVLVTGKVVLIGARGRPLLEGGIRRWVEEHRVRFSWEWRATRDEQVLRLVGSGPDWASRNYVALATDLFERGLCRCLVGTRGIFGEGWDALRLNTLVDLTSVTTRTGVQQIRGRSIRLDPAWPRKVAHNWDVVCVSPEFDKGNADLRRFAARHEHTWGLIIHPQPETPSEALKQTAVQVKAPQTVATRTLEGEGVATPATLQGRVVRGLAHIDLQLAVDLATREFQRLGYDAYTRRMMDAVWERDRVYDLWAVGQPYENQIYSTTRIEVQDLKFRTAHTVQGSLRTLIGRTFSSALAVGGAALVNGALVIPWAQAQALPQLGLASVVLTGAAAVAVVAANGRRMWQVVQQSFVELPVDAILLDMGRALLAALRDTGLISTHLDDDCVRVAQVPDGGYEIFVDPAYLEAPASLEAATTPQDAALFAQAFRQMLGPLGDARYLIERDVNSLRNPLHRASWLLVRKALRLEEDLKAYHRVPDVLASRRQRAEALAYHWQHYVGGGRLVYTRTDEGRRILLQARARQRRQIRQMAFEIWK
jgi:superfamily II DNA or RNA helicase